MSTTTLLSTNPYSPTGEIPWFSKFYVFGDSLSDPGNIYNVTLAAQPIAPFLGLNIPVTPVSPPYAQRFSNGLVWVEYLEESLGLDAKPSTKLSVLFPFLPIPSPFSITSEGIGISPYFNGATTTQSINFAFGGAGTGFDGIEPFGELIPGIRDQVDWFIFDHQLSQKSADPNALYVVWGGPNDYWGNPAPDPKQAVLNLETSIRSLYSLGARHFLIPNLPDLGKTPFAYINNSTDLLTGTSLLHNTLLNSAIARLNQELPALDLIPLDVYSLFLDALANPANYGAINVTEPGLNLTTLIPLANSEKYLFWDDIHPTTLVHDRLANFALQALITGYTDVVAPILSANLTAISNAGALTYTFSVIYTDDKGVNLDTLDDFDLRVTGPSGFDQLARLVSVSASGQRSQIATYQITAPRGFWTLSDNGTYTVRVEPNQVADISGNIVEATVIGEFAIAINGWTFTGDAGPNIYIGTPGDDIFNLGGGNDTARGGDGNDALWGGDGKDHLLGGNGDDWLVGGAKGDRLIGGLGADRFSYPNLTDSLINALDSLDDFNQREGDRLYLPSNPTQLFNAGRINALSLNQAIALAYADKNQSQSGQQRLAANEAVFLTWKGDLYLSINNSISTFNAQHDLVVKMSGAVLAPGDSLAGVLSVDNYFVST